MATGSSLQTLRIALDQAAQSEYLEAIMRSIDPLPDLSELLHRPAWQEKAACRGKGLDEFFPPEGSSPIRAAPICARCPVAVDCLAYALENPSLKGVWAGTSERGRRRMRAEMEAAQQAKLGLDGLDPTENVAG